MRLVHVAAIAALLSLPVWAQITPYPVNPSTLGQTTIVGMTAPTVTITQGGSAGAAAYAYTIVGTDAYGGTMSASATTATGNATLSGTNYNIVTISAWSSTSPNILPQGACSVYRTSGGASTGKIGTVNSCAAGGVLNDTGLAGDSGTAPSNTSGNLTVPGTLAVVNTVSAANIAQIPPPTGLLAWHKSSTLNLSNGAGVATWADSSGRGNDLTQATGGNQPLYTTNVFGTIPSVRFDGVASFMTWPSSLATVMNNNSIYLISRQNGQRAYLSHMASYANLGTAATPTTIYWIADAPNLNQIQLAVTGYNDTSTVLMPNMLCLNGVASGSVRALQFINDTIGTSTHSIGATAQTTGVLGAKYLSATPQYFSALDVVEVLIYDHMLNLAEYKALQAYAYTTYPILHSGFTQQVFFLGNSITAGHGILTANTYPNVVAAGLGKNVLTYNVGREFATTAQLVTNIASTVTNYYNSNYAKNVLVAFEVRNDICTGGASPTTAYNNLVSLAQAAKAANFTVVIGTSPTPSAGCTTQQSTDIATVNTNIRANIVATGYVDAVADLAANACIADNANATHNCYNADQIHWSDAGAIVAAGIVLPILNSLGVH